MEQIKLNTIPSGVPSVCHISQFDNTSRIIRCHLFNGLDPLTLTGSETIHLFMRKSNNSRAEFEIESTSGAFIDLVITSEMSDIAGDSECKFQITDSEKTIGTLNFKMVVEPDAYGDSLKTRSISGPIATFETDLAEDLIKLDVDLEPIQDLHGYDNPWPAGGNINRLDLSSSLVYNPSVYGLAVTLEDDVIRFNGTYNRDAPSASFRILKNFSFLGDEAPSLKFFEITSTGKITGVRFDDNNNAIAVNMTNLVLNTAYDIKFKIMGYVGSAPTEYTPYSNICPISGHDSAKLFRINKNLLEKPFAFYSQVPDNLSEMFFIKAGTYIVSFNETAVANWRFAIRLKDVNGNNLSTNEFKPESGMGWRDLQNFWLDGANSSRKYRVLNIVKDCYIRILFGFGETTATTVFTDVQLELGSAATDYEPYESDPTPVTVQFGQTVYGGTLDSANRVLRVDTRYMVFDGTQEIGLANWRPLNNSVGWLYRPNITPNIKNYVVDESNLPYCKLKSDRLQTVVYGGAQGLYGKDSPCISLVGTEYWGIGMRVNDTSLTSATTINNWLSQNPIEVIYELAEPFFIDLTQIQTASIDSTPVASFETTLAMPLNTSEHSFSCSQAEGTPTPENPIPITGVSEITAYRTGKNLLSPILYKGLSYNPTVGTTVTLTESPKQLTDNHDGTFSISTTTNWETFCMIVPIKSTTYYRKTVISSNGALGTSEVWLDKNLKVISAYNNTDTTQTKNGLLTIPDNASYFAWVITNRAVANSTLTITQPQLEFGSTATPYEPYNGESITVSLGGTYYGGKLVQQEDGSRKLILSLGACDLGSATYQYNSTYNVFISDFHTIEPYAKDNFIAKCQIYNYKGSYNVVKNNNMSFGYIYNSQFCFRDDRYNQDPLAFKAGVSGVYVYYELATPIEIDLPNGDPLTTIAGENNVYCNTGDTALTYYYNMVADPIRIPALVGTNNVYSDAGDVDVEYYTTLEGGND